MIRLFLMEDADAVFQIGKYNFEHSITKLDILHWPSTQARWVFDYNNKVVGFIFMDAGTCEVKWLAMAQGFSSRGFGKRLLDHGLRWLRDQGKLMSFLIVNIHNDRAVKFYQREGWTPVRCDKEEEIFYMARVL